MKYSIQSRIFFIIIIFIFGSQEISAQKKDRKIIAKAEAQLEILWKETTTARKDRRNFPRSQEGDSIRMVRSNDWTSGFWPGMLWYMHEYTNKPVWKERAIQMTELMEREPGNGNSHDVGFKVYNSYGHAYRLTGESKYRDSIIKAANTLIARFNPTVGCIRSWDFGKWQYPVIIDNMMNLELLFAATRLSGDSNYYKVAVTHANTTMKNHFRQDYSTYHVVDYDTLTGKMIGGSTHQGYADNSTWARGMAWALYGYVMCYRETKDVSYLNLAEKIASFLMNHPRLPADGVPYWDFDAPNITSQPRDASAAAIIASAMYELRVHTREKKYSKFATKLFTSLTKNYRAEYGTHKGFLLKHSTGHKPANGEVDVPIIYADYYWLECLGRTY
jgi:rhamnogalacturonyl hydrolase YesR